MKAALVLVLLAVGGSQALFGAESASNRHDRAMSDSARPKVACASERSTCQNFDKEVEKGINRQINEELKASYVYQAMAFHCERDDVALRGFGKKFKDMSDEERTHAQGLMTYMNKRGGTILLSDIPKPSQSEWDSGLAMVNAALKLEHYVNTKLLDLHWTAQEKNDVHLQDFLEGEYLTEQVDSIKELADWSKVLTRVKSNPLGEHLFDQELFDGKR